jgi:lipopolysaccharide transport system ATP-binding protein
MSDIAIRVENLSKLYRLGLIGSGTLRDDLNHWWARLRRKPDPLAKITHSPNGHSATTDDRRILIFHPSSLIIPISSGLCATFPSRACPEHGEGSSAARSSASLGPSTALRRLRAGAGRNGAGNPSTALRLRLALRLLRTRLTGRENIYLNGAILGIKRVEIARKFDEIVACAVICRHANCDSVSNGREDMRVEKFIDAPVKPFGFAHLCLRPKRRQDKHHSSGMYVRLAFAVAALLH